MRLALAIWAVLGVELAACGYYGPPTRPEPSDAGTEAPLPEPDAPDEKKGDRDGP